MGDLPLSGWRPSGCYNRRAPALQALDSAQGLTKITLTATVS